MSQLDRLVEAMRGARASALRLRVDDVARLVRDGAEHALTRQPLTRAQVENLMRERTPAALLSELEAGRSIHFEFDGPGGRYHAEVSVQGGEMQVRPVATAVGGVTPDGDIPRGSSASREAIESLLRRMVEQRASDLHLRSGAPPMMRIDGHLKAVEDQPSLNDEIIRGMLRSIMAHSMSQTYESTHDADFAHEIDGYGRFRGNAFVERTGAGAVFRAIPSKLVTAEELGLSAEVQALCQLTKGLVLVTGPTGSGKSTTLCAMMDLINRTRQDHIITIEDPIEFVHQRKGCLITQRQVGLHTGSFKAALRAALREDPDVVLVGELRDLETMAIAIETAETGHLVFGTLHTSTAASTIDRIIDQFPADQQSQVRVMLSESLKGVISQVLCRKVRGGRVAAMEILLSTPAVANLIRESKTFQIPSVMQTSRKAGMVTLTDALLELVDKHLIDAEEAYLRAMDKSAILQGLKQRGHNTSFVDGFSAPAGPQAPGAAGRPTPMGRAAVAGGR